MISPLKFMERIGVSGRLLAFFKAVCVYFAVCAGEGGAPSAGGAAAKCAPVLCLLVIVLAARADLHKQDEIRRRYCSRVSLGLALSAVGDALLVWPQHFVPGMGAFAAAHLAYIAAFGWHPLAPRRALPLAIGLAWYLYVVRARGVLGWLVPAYAGVLATMAWRGCARLPAPPRLPAAGAALFLLSDAALGYTMFHTPLPYAQWVVMSTYYLAQLGIALSALEAPPRAPPVPPAPAM